ncbi:PREDICTED: uncharacterized protein LOC103344713 [Prunus mume]|uniref:Uncharacterized protein LOC103344713 n=1 Tax=Prunus mume TaxID=102107 RepID=A0ABM1LZ01_PRUMU|nr:PREDICTED: uncharacterized protein LOC103344713 [Prunus mume]
MDKKAFNLEELELKQRKLALPLKDLLDYFDSFRNGILTRLQEVQDHEKQMGVLENQVQAKANELRGIERLIEEKLKEVESGTEHLRSLQLLIKEHNEEISVKEKRFSDVQRWVGEKEKEYDSIEKSINWGTSKLNWYEKTVEEKSKLVESKEKELREVQRLLNKYSEDIQLKERQLNEILGSIEKQNKIFALKEEKIKEARRLVDECDKEMKLKKEKLGLIQKSIVEFSKTIESKHKIIRGMDLKVKFFSLHKKSMEELFCKLELKEKQFESKVEEISLIEKGVTDCLNEVQLKENHLDSLEQLIQECGKHLDSQEKSLQECSNGLEKKERKLEQWARELELKQQQINSIQKSTEEHTQTLEYTHANIATIPSSASNHSSINRDGRCLLLLMNENLKRIALLSSEMSAHLKASSDPAELVLNAMEEFYPSNSAVDKMKFDFDLTVIRRSCILLLQELKRLSPQINHQVKEKAIKLAADWKDKMTVAAENVLEVLGFLWLLTAFELTSTYDERELQSFLAVVTQPEDATDLSQALGITNKAPGSTLSFPVKTEEPESSQVRNVATSPSPNFQPSATTDERNLQGCIKEHLSGDNLVQNEMFDALRMSFNPEKLVLNLMKTSLDQYWKKGDVGFEATLMKIHIPLLKELMKVLPHVRDHVEEDAMELAVQWKERLRADSENSLEIFSFLQFIATYGLLSFLNGDEIVKLLGMISQHKQALELHQTLGFSDKIPDFIQNLIERKQLIEALRFICTFEVVHKFPPVRLIKEYVEDARKSYWTKWMEKKSQNEKDIVVKDQIADLRAVIQCIKDYNLESEYPSKDIESEILQLGKLKESWRPLQISFTSKLGQREHEERKKRSTSTSAPKFQPPEKRQNISHPTPLAAIPRPYALPTFNSDSSRLYENYGHPGRFVMDANDHQIGANGAMQLSSSSLLHETGADKFGMVASNQETGANFGAVELSSSSRLYENYRHPAQFHMAAAANEHETGANFGAMGLSSSSLLYETYGHPAQFRMAAANNVHEIGTNFSAMQNAGLPHSHHLLPNTHSYDPNQI